MKKMIWGGMTIGSVIGGAIPFMWTLNTFSFSSVICTAIGGFVGIYCGLKLAKMLGIE
jgi:hypothetical protein